MNSMTVRGRVKGFLFILVLLGVLYLAFAVLYGTHSSSSPTIISKDNRIGQETQRMQQNNNVGIYSNSESVKSNTEKPQDPHDTVVSDFKNKQDRLPQEQDQRPQQQLLDTKALEQQALIERQQIELRELQQKLDDQKQHLKEAFALLKQQQLQQSQQQQLQQQQLQQQQLQQQQPQQQQTQEQLQQEELFQKFLATQQKQGEQQQLQQNGIFPSQPQNLPVADNHIPNPPAVPAQPSGNNGLHPDVIVVPATPSPNLILPHKECVNLPESPRPGVKICIHPVIEDKWVSGSLKKNKLWEENLVLMMKKALENDTSLMLMDVGCNIGEYTLMAAAMGRKVVAVEMLMANVQLVQTSLQLSGLSDKVTIVNNALYRDHRVLQTKFMSQNLGGSRLNTSNVYEPIDHHRAAVSVKTVCLDDLVPLIKIPSVYMKMDIENSEHHALACAHNFFKQINVKVVQMEWLNRTPAESTEIVNFMNTHGYLPSKSPIEYIPVADNFSNGDRFFLKKSAFHL